MPTRASFYSAVNLTCKLQGNEIQTAESCCVFNPVCEVGSRERVWNFQHTVVATPRFSDVFYSTK